MLCIIEHLVCVIIVIIIISISYIGYGTVETKALRGNRCTMGIFFIITNISNYSIDFPWAMDICNYVYVVIVV